MRQISRYGPYLIDVLEGQCYACDIHIDEVRKHLVAFNFL